MTIGGAVYKFCFFVPVSHLEQVKQAVFEAGAGKLGDYEACCWQTKGQGQFRPLIGSHPSIGAVGQIEVVDEYKVEMVCDPSLLPAVLRVFKRCHPYETPAYDIYKLEGFE